MRKPQSVTHIWTVDATMVDSGSGMETANLFAHGPGLLETRPIPDKMDSPLKDVPPDRTAVWQDLMMLKNLLGPDQKIVQKELVLKGYPRVVDRLKQQSLDAVDTIVVWLKPKPAESTPAKSATANGDLRSKRPRRFQRGGRQLPDPATACPARCPPGRALQEPDRSRSARCRFQGSAQLDDRHANYCPGNLTTRGGGIPIRGCRGSGHEDRRAGSRGARRKSPNPRWSPWPTAWKPTS